MKNPEPLKLSSVYRVPHTHVKILTMNGDRIQAGDYHGVASGGVAEHNCNGCHFQVMLPGPGIRRPLPCQIIVSPLDVTVVIRPSELDALGLLTRSFQVVPVENQNYWSAALTIWRQGGFVTYGGSAKTPAVAITNAVNEALDHKAEWIDVDPLDVSPQIEEVPVFESPDFSPCIEPETQGPVS